MTIQFEFGPPPRGMTQVLAFTLGTALALVGHECRGGCPTQASTMRTSAWFVQARHGDDSRRPDTLVFVRFPYPGRADAPDDATIPALLDAVNECTRNDNIRVHRRASVGHGPDDDLQ